MKRAHVSVRPISASLFHHLLTGELDYTHFSGCLLTGKQHGNNTEETEYEEEKIPIRPATVKKFKAYMCKSMGGTGSSISDNEFLCIHIQ